MKGFSQPHKIKDFQEFKLGRSEEEEGADMGIP